MPPRRALSHAALISVVLTTLAPRAHAEEQPLSSASSASAAHPERLSLFAAAGYLGSPGASGGAFSSGLRLRLGAHFAGSFDVGYGILDTFAGTQDRWWAMPAIAFVVPAGPVRLDLGLGGGVGTSSGYASWSAYTAAPFTPTWHATVPAARAHAIASIPITRDTDAFLRADVATLVLAGSGSSHTGAEDSLWVALWVGLSSRLM
jgi:hypothetical protein